MAIIKNRKVSSAFRWISTCSYAAVILYLSLQLITSKPLPMFTDKVGHTIAYLLLSVLIRWSLRITPLRDRAITPYIAAGIATAYGGLTEIFQINITYRDAEWGDAIANAIGAFAAIPITALLLSIRSRWRKDYAGSYQG